MNMYLKKKKVNLVLTTSKVRTGILEDETIDYFELMTANGREFISKRFVVKIEVLDNVE